MGIQEAAEAIRAARLQQLPPAIVERRLHSPAIAVAIESYLAGHVLSVEKLLELLVLSLDDLRAAQQAQLTAMLAGAAPPPIIIQMDGESVTLLKERLGQ